MTETSENLHAPRPGSPGSLNENQKPQKELGIQRLRTCDVCVNVCG